MGFQLLRAVMVGFAHGFAPLSVKSLFGRWRDPVLRPQFQEGPAVWSDAERRVREDSGALFEEIGDVFRGESLEETGIPDGSVDGILAVDFTESDDL